MDSHTPAGAARSLLEEFLQLIGLDETAPRLGPSVLQSLARLLETDAVTVHEREPDGALRLVGATGVPAEVASALASLAPRSAALAARCAVAGAVLRIERAALTEAVDRAVCGDDATAHLVAVPLLARGRTRGVAAFVERAGRRAPSSVREAVAVALGLALAAAAEPEVSSWSVFRETLSATWDLTAFWARRPFAYSGAQATFTQSTGDLREFLAILAERARVLAGAELAAIGIGHSADAPFDPWVAVGLSPERFRALESPPRPVGTLGAVAIGGETIRVANVHEHPAFRGLPANHPELRSLLAVPLRFRDQSVGNLYLANKRGAAAFDRMDQAAIEILGMVGTMLIMIERDRMRLHQIVNRAPDGFVFIDAISGHVMANREYAELFGERLTAEAGLAQVLGAVLTPDGEPVALEDLPSARALAEEATVERELVFVRPDASRVTVVARTAPVRNLDGTVIGAVSTFRDVTRQVELLASLEQQRRNLRAVLDAAPDGILVLDARTQVVLGNPAFERLLGRAIDPAAGEAQELGILHGPQGGGVAIEDLPSHRALRTGEHVRQELLFVRADGSRLPVEEHAAPIRAPDGAIVGVVVTCRDLTAQKELERIREEIAVVVAHDLRNPIQAILMQAQLLEDALAAGRPIQGEALGRLTRLAQRMGRITSDLLDTARLDLAEVALTRAPRDAAEAVREVVELVQPSLGDHPIQVGAEGPASSILLDPSRFEQILANLLENAAKYSEAGAAIQVEVRRVGAEVEIAVRDHGMGIAPSELPRLFDRFYQAERARKLGRGLGLGLYIARGFVEAHGGRLTVDSVVDHGSTFHVFFPAVEAVGPGEAGEPPPRE